MAFTLMGPVKFQGHRDSEGHREYKVSYLCVTQSNQDGPLSAMNTPGLPLIGDTYIFGTDNEFDLWAWCRPDIEVTEAPGYEFGNFPYSQIVTVTFSTKPRKREKERPHQPDIDDPLNEPQKVSGSFAKYTEEANFDRFGQPILNSAFEKYRGASNEWDKNRPSIVIEQNVPMLQLGVVAPIVDTLNKYPLWGLPARSIKLSNFAWSKHYPKQTSVYYTRTFTFDIRYKQDTISAVVTANLSSGSPNITGAFGYDFSSADIGRVITGPGIPPGTVIISIDQNSNSAVMSNAATDDETTTQFNVFPGPSGLIGDWDRDLLDEGTKALRGHWLDLGTDLGLVWEVDPPNLDSTNPANFVRLADQNGNPMKVFLDGNGSPVDQVVGFGDGVQGIIHVEYYPESDFAGSLAIPLTF